MNYSPFLPVILCCCLLGGATFTTDSVAATDESDYIYGKGVHAFFDCNYEEAVKVLSQADELKSEDPRPYYFLGLAHLRQKNVDQADLYFKKAAQLEYGGRALRDYAVPESLRRIQGEERLRIEKIRAEERITARANEQRRQEMRYSRDTVAARTDLRQTTSQNQNENLAVLQEEAGVAADNPFGVKPIDPTNASDESIVARVAPANPFGTIEASTHEEPAVLVPAGPARRAPVAAQPERRVFVNPNVQAQPRAVDDAASTGQDIGNVVQGMQVEAARQVGRALGALFSRKPKEE